MAQAADPQLVEDIQFLLATLGWELGPADGILGERTRLAILEAQQRYGFTPADGAPSAALRDFLDGLGTGAPVTAESVAPAEPVAPVAQMAPPADSGSGAVGTQTTAATGGGDAEEIDAIAATLIGSRWTIADSTGAILTLDLQADGRIVGPTEGSSWTWHTAGNTITLAYESGIGDWVRREGVVVDRDSMRGGGESSLGTNWTWTARRLP